MLKPPNETARQLMAARELIADKKNWCQGTLCDDQGRMCAMEALWEIVGVRKHDRVKAIQTYAVTVLEKKLERFTNGLCLWQVNDDFGHAAVLAVFDKAIAAEIAEAVDV